MEPIVTEGLTKYYGKLLALDNLNMKIPKGKCVGFLGPNGAGKSTTIKILCNLIFPTKGEVHVNGFNSSKNPKNALEDVGCIIEAPSFYPYLNPMDVLSYFGKLRGIGGLELKRRMKEVLEFVDLSKWAKTKIGKFSRGMKQRLGVAQAILHDPSILILDEPALGLDPRGVVGVRENIKEMKMQGKTIFFASHMLYEVREVCDVVALIDKGKLLAYDNVENLEKIFRVQVIEVELLQPPKPRELKKLKKLKAVKSVSLRKNYLEINFSGDRATRAELLTALVKDLKLQVASFRPSAAALEEIYLQLVKE